MRHHTFAITDIPKASAVELTKEEEGHFFSTRSR